MGPTGAQARDWPVGQPPAFPTAGKQAPALRRENSVLLGKNVLKSAETGVRKPKPSQGRKDLAVREAHLLR